jgi:hypothetical protein
MKIISLASDIAGPACAIATSVKKYFYNNSNQTNIFDYLEITLSDINKLLNNYDISFVDDLHIYINRINKSSVNFNKFNKMISHHDLAEEYNENDLQNFKEKYIRRYNRLFNHLKNENDIFFLRFSDDNNDDILNFINIIKKINTNLNFKFIHLFYDEKNINNFKHENYIYINFYNYIDNTKTYNEDLFFKTIEFDWKVVYNIIYENLSTNDKNNFVYYA